MKPPFEIYGASKNDIADADGHICTAEDAGVAQEILAALSGIPQRLARVDDALARRLSESIGRNGKLSSENAQLRAALQGMVDHFKPFTMRRIGGPGSAARLDQEAQIKAHADAVAALKGGGQ